MKKFVCMILLGFCLALPGAAQNTAKPKKIKTMIDYKDQLNLSQEQVNAVAGAFSNFQSTVRTQKAALQTHEAEFKSLRQANAPLSEIKAKLQQIANTRSSLRYADVLTSRKVREALSAEQMKKWRAIQAQARTKK